MSPRWRRRVATAAGCWFVLCVVMAALDLSPRVVLLAGITAAVVAVSSLVTDLADAGVPTTWDALHHAEPLARGADLRLRALQGQMVHGGTIDDGRELHRMLVELADDQLRAAHGVDRAVDPARADALLGTDLSRFVHQPPAPKQLADPLYLDGVIAAIESL
jgi:hypothetical protein